MQAKHSLEFARAPAIWSMYPGILVSRKPALVPADGEVPRIEARLAKVSIDRKHLASYSEICGTATGATLPIAYPHVLAMPLHLAILGAEAFPVKLLGLVHLHNRIAMRQPLSAEEPAEIRAWIEGYRDTERGQEFDLHTEYVVGGEPLWDETCTFLARRKPAPGSPRASLSRSVEGAPEGAAVKSSSFRAPAGLGRRYGFVSGDVNPIHMSDLTARAFGFPRAIAHGMWSLGRVASEFEAGQPFDGGCELSVSFKLPIYMPSWLMLQRWDIENGSAFALRDGQGEKPHLAGTLKSLR